MGLFSRKKEKLQENPQESPEFLKLLKKWDIFLEKIEARFDESLVNAKEALFENLEESNYDLHPTMIAWQGIKSQLMALSHKTETTFDEKVLPQMLEYKEHHALLDEAYKGRQLRSAMNKKIDRFELILEGEIATMFYNHAVKQLNEMFHCTQCSAKLEVRKDVFHSHYVSCTYCNTVNTFTPNDKITAIRWVVDNIAKLKALPEWDEMKKAQNDFHDIRPPASSEDKAEYTAGFNKREIAEKAFWTKYFTERSIYLPKYAETIEADVKNKMKWFYDERKRELNF